MKKSERKDIIKWAGSLSDEDLENEYYKSVFDSLGSQTEDMYKLGYDIRDIIERELYEKYLCERSSLIEELCEKRGIKLWYKDDSLPVFTELDKSLYSDRKPYIEEELEIILE